MFGLMDAVVILGLGLFALGAINSIAGTVEECTKAKYSVPDNDTGDLDVIEFDYTEDNDNE